MATEQQTVVEGTGWKVCLVREHQRARPGEAGSDYKPVNVREHFRQIGDDGSEVRLKWTCDVEAMSAELVESMAEVINVTGFPKNHRWTLKQAQYVLSKGMRYSGRRWWFPSQWGKPICVDKDVNETMKMIDRVLAGRKYGRVMGGIR